MRALKTLLAIACGSAALFFLVMSGSGGDAGMRVGLGFFAFFALLTFLLARKTKADRRREDEKRSATSWAFPQPAGEGTREPGGAGKWLALNLLVNIVITPFVIIGKLLKMQK